MKSPFHSILAAVALALCLTPAIHADNGNNDRVSVGSDNHIAAGETVQHDAVAVMGDLVVDGNVPHDAVAVMGSNTMNGSAGHDTVAVMGDVKVNGPVGHDVVAVMGDVTLGPRAVVGHDVVSVGGTIHKDPLAVVGGNMVSPVPFGGLHLIPHGDWWTHGLRTGRVLAFSHDLEWLWIFHLVVLAFFALLALVFPRGVNRCGDVLAERPGMVLLTGLVTLVALPILFILLLITIVGIPVAILALPLAVIALFFFGKASILGLIGRKIVGDSFPPALAVLVGGVLVLVLYLVPFGLGLLFSLLLSLLGFSCATTALFLSMQRPAAPKAPAAPPPPPAPAYQPTPPPAFPAPAGPSVTAPTGVTPPAPPAPTQNSGSAATDAALPAVPPPLASEPPPVASVPLSAPRAPHISVIGAPRAGFWIRTWALLVDLILVGIISAPFREVVHVTHLANGLSIDSPGMLPLIALYGALMWRLRGTTVGGIIFGLKVVRLDDRPIDWATAIVRALGCFLSLVVIGLGFFWVAFDDEKQSWHDKIAGTVVVRVPKGVSLV
jgi:uncharacterized RDD family membrane protein YckC